MALDNSMKLGIGQEYFKRKLFRQIVEWFKDFINSYSVEEITENILNNRYIVKNVENDLLKNFSKENIIKYLPEIELYSNSMTEDNKITLIKMIYNNLPEYREVFSKNQGWLSNQVRQALIAFDSYIIKIKADTSTSK